VGRREQSRGEVDMDTGKMLAAAVMVSATASVALAGQEIVRIDDIRTDRIESVGFQLDKGGEFIIEALGLCDRRNDDLIAYGWILNGQTREPVWVMDRSNTDRAGQHGLCRAEKEIHLDPGRYEAYYYAAGRWSGKIIFNDRNIFEFLGDLLDGDFEDRDVFIFPSELGMRILENIGYTNRTARFQGLLFS
jgi:hypothetical protein